ncbi:hypothetical protein K458DRAFT_44844 [Lentithecium fluviatile CBS 122367]|uniref:Uncharacterized protein n=1 Tax=Lentithecium fluviatile CBS 122367 TaxID=1168545 RepID=A0A6G1IYY1_9PLEO|nr:hypothetical protein K458DRAFT_44844 [Lentithecium fluviatile CBS 122367]
MPLNYDSTDSFSATRQEEFEALRTAHVPRYLFTAWTSAGELVHSPTGNYMPVTEYATTHLVPAGFFYAQNERSAQNVEGQPFYDQSEANLLVMANAHVNGQNTPLTEFSTWSSSLLGTLFHAASMAHQKEKKVHVTMVDRMRLDGGALFWHAPDLLGDIGSVHEYLAHGPVRGPGFKTATWERLIHNGLNKLVPKLKARTNDKYGQDLRANIFQDAPTQISDEDIATARQVAALFGDLEIPATIILLAMSPRIVTHETGNSKYLRLNELFQGLGRYRSIGELAEESWLNRKGRIYADSESLDIKEWVILLYSLASAISIRVIE